MAQVRPGRQSCSCSEAAAGTLIVSKRPSHGQYSTIQAAVDALSTRSTGDQVICISAGVYQERVRITNRQARLTIYGETDDAGSYFFNRVTITQSSGQADGLVDKNPDTATLDVYAEDFSLYNVNIINTYGESSQAVALSAQATKQGFYACQFKSYQNTALAQIGSQLFAHCLFEGAVDVLFGENVRAVVHGSTFSILPVKQGWILAPGGIEDKTPAWLVVDKSIIQAAPGHQVAPGSIYLGRPWGPIAKATVQMTEMSDIIKPEGWDIWTKEQPHTERAQLREFKNSGPGAQGHRASFSQQESKRVTMEEVLGDMSWVDLSALSGRPSSCGRASF